MANQYINSNILGALLVWGTGSILAYYRLFRHKYKRKINKEHFLNSTLWGVILIGNAFVLVGMLGSRASFVILLAVTIITLFRLDFKGLIARVLVLSFPAFLLFTSILVNPGSLTESFSANTPFAPLVNRLSSIEEDQAKDNKFSRNNLALNGIKIFLDHPILGAGIGNEATKMQEYAYTRKVSHNTIVSLLSELGVAGIIFIVGLIIIWIPYIKDGFALSLLLMIGLYAMLHNITLLSFPWLLLSFYKRCYDSVKIRKIAR